MQFHPRVRLKCDQQEFLLSEIGRAYDVGRLPDSDIRIKATGISRKHCRMSFNERRKVWTVRDLGSKHGTVVNGVVIDSPTPLEDGDQISLGGLVLDVAVLDEAPKPKPLLSESQKLPELEDLPEIGLEEEPPRIKRKLKKKSS